MKKRRRRETQIKKRRRRRRRRRKNVEIRNIIRRYDADSYCHFVLNELRDSSAE